MKFHDYVTVLDQLYNSGDLHGSKEAMINDLPAMREIIALLAGASRGFIGNAGCVAVNFAHELLWLRNSRYYAKVWPAYVQRLADTSLDIPVGIVIMPAGGICVRFPVGRELVLDNLRLCAFLIMGANLRSKTKDLFVSIMVRRRHDPGFGWLTYSIAINSAAVTFAAAIQQCMLEHPVNNPIYGLALDRVCRIGIAVLLLHSCHGIVEKDIVPEEYKNYLRAVQENNQDEIKRIEDKSYAAYGRVGITIGHRDSLWPKRPGASRDSDTVTDEQRQYRMLRPARLYRTWQTIEEYPDWERQVTTFRPMLVIRPDLPPPPDEEQHLLELLDRHGRLLEEF